MKFAPRCLSVVLKRPLHTVHPTRPSSTASTKEMALTFGYSTQAFEVMQCQLGAGNSNTLTSAIAGFLHSLRSVLVSPSVIRAVELCLA